MDANAPVSSKTSCAKNTRRNQTVLATAAAIPFLLSLGFHAAGPKAQEPEPGARRPALVFDQYMVDYGPIRAEAHAFAHFVFHNRGSEPVRITSVEPSCGCMTSEFKNRKMEYAPGEVGEFDLTVRTTRETPGQKDYYVKVRYEDPDPREIDVTFRFVLPEQQVRVEPAALIFYQNGQKETSQTIVVTDNRPKPLEVRDVTTTSNLVSAKIDKVEDLPEGPRRTHIVVTAAQDVPAGKAHREVIALLTSDSKYSELQVPVMVQRTGSEVLHEDEAVQVSPSSLTLVPTRDKRADAEITLTDSRTRAMQVKDVRSSSPAVTAQLNPRIETDSSGHTQWKIAVSAVGDLPPGRFRSVITVRTDDPVRPELQIPVQVHVVDPQAAERTSEASKPAAN
ncbi:MAG: DUF1573 domain-containing protein [Planctomycetaceae bacterium]